ncbi:DUF547 domain-containing protein [Pseudomonas sp. B11D7D]|nr:DUF547 domain-containing protein [Pseudomonas sp. B11D7D]QNH03971.1 DUF547 domain-containing protein [Pseudomonas sp. B11D7D]
MRLFLLALLFSGVLQAETFDHQHRTWTRLLERHVVWLSSGHASVVDYSGFQQDMDELETYLNELSAVPSDEYRRWQVSQRLAFLINAYNAFTVKLVTDHYPVGSIKDIGGLFSSPWRQAFIPLLGQTLSLDQIEHSLIREPGVFDEPRIHFAVNCASVGCPALRNEAFVAERLDEQLEDSQRRFLSDQSRNRFDPIRQRLQISKIFDWYGEDFSREWGSLENYFNQHLTLLSPSTKQYTPQKKLRIEYLDYDWSLNDKG